MKPSNLDEESKAKMASKFRPEDAEAARGWLSKVCGRALTADFYAAVKNGAVLCEAMLKLSPGCIPAKAWTAKPKNPFDSANNIKAFLGAAAKFGVEASDLFSERDLGDLNRDLVPVVDCIFALSRAAQAKGLGAPVLGPNYYRTDEDNRRIQARKDAENKALAEAKAKMEQDRAVRREELENENLEKAEERKQESLTRSDGRAGYRKEANISGRKSPPRKEAERLHEIKFGADKEQRDKMSGQYKMNYGDLVEKEMNWIEEITKEQVNDFHLDLKSGRTLCRLVNEINALAGDSPMIAPKKISPHNNKLKEMANLDFFLQACAGFGMSKGDIFEASDLYDARNLGFVARTLQKLASLTSPDYDLKYSKVPRLQEAEVVPNLVIDPALESRRSDARKGEATAFTTLKTSSDPKPHKPVEPKPADPTQPAPKPSPTPSPVVKPPPVAGPAPVVVEPPKPQPLPETVIPIPIAPIDLTPRKPIPSAGPEQLYQLIVLLIVLGGLFVVLLSSSPTLQHKMMSLIKMDTKEYLMPKPVQPPYTIPIDPSTEPTEEPYGKREPPEPEPSREEPTEEPKPTKTVLEIEPEEPAKPEPSTEEPSKPQEPGPTREPEREAPKEGPKPTKTVLEIEPDEEEPSKPEPPREEPKEEPEPPREQPTEEPPHEEPKPTKIILEIEPEEEPQKPTITEGQKPKDTEAPLQVVPGEPQPANKPEPPHPEVAVAVVWDIVSIFMWPLEMLMSFMTSVFEAIGILSKVPTPNVLTPVVSS